MSLRLEFPKTKAEIIEAIAQDLELEMRAVLRKPPTKPNMVAFTDAWLNKILDIKHIINTEI